MIIFTISSLYIFASSGEVPSVGQVRIEFIIFSMILLSVALFHKQTFWIAIPGLVVRLTFKLIFDPGFQLIEHMFGTTSFSEQLMGIDLRQRVWGIIINFLGLLLSFAILSKIFEESLVPDILPRYFQYNWKGHFLLLMFVLSFRPFSITLLQ